MMCDMYRYIFLFNIMIQNWLLCVLIHQISRPGFSNLPNFIPKSNYNKLVCITLIDLFYYLLTTTRKQDIYLHYKSISIISNIMTVLCHGTFGSDTQYYFLVVSHIPIHEQDILKGALFFRLSSKS